MSSARIEEEIWTDHWGQSWKVIPIKTPNNKAQIRYRALTTHIFHRDENKCCFCGSKTNLSLDHIVPKRFGGSNHPQNLQTLCRSCNSKKVRIDREKHDKTP